MSYRDDEKRWKRIQDMLAAEASGKNPRPAVSQRTLFGIPSTVEQTIERIVAQDEKERRMKRQVNQPKEHVDHPLEPVFDERSRILVLGTMPSPASRASGFYYGHPQNRFWQVLAKLFDEPIATTTDRKRDQLLRHHIALWDVLASCRIDGASDASIADAVPNDLSVITSTAPIEKVICTGAKAADLYKSHCEPTTEIQCIKLPSTSSANAATSLEDLVEAYGVILQYLHEQAPRTLNVPAVVQLEQTIANAGTSLAELMDRAGLSIAHRIHSNQPKSCVAVLCGTGNNGGDGWVAARYLAEWGHDVTLVTSRLPAELTAEPARSAAVDVYRNILGDSLRVLVNPSEMELDNVMEKADVIIDAILGTGFSGTTVKNPYDGWMTASNRRHAFGGHVVSADVPSGLNAQTGNACKPCIIADETITMMVLKPGLTHPDSRRFCGAITIAPLAYLEPFLS